MKLTGGCIYLAFVRFSFAYLVYLAQKGNFEKDVLFVLTESLFYGTIYLAHVRRFRSDKKCRTAFWEKYTNSANGFVQNGENSENHKI